MSVGVARVLRVPPRQQCCALRSVYVGQGATILHRSVRARGPCVHLHGSCPVSYCVPARLSCVPTRLVAPNAGTPTWHTILHTCRYAKTRIPVNSDWTFSGTYGPGTNDRKTAFIFLALVPADAVHGSGPLWANGVARVPLAALAEPHLWVRAACASTSSGPEA